MLLKTSWGIYLTSLSFGFFTGKAFNRNSFPQLSINLTSETHSTTIYRVPTKCPIIAMCCHIYKAG